MDTNATEYLRVLNEVCRQLDYGTDALEVERAVRAMHAINSAHALLPALEAKARQLKGALGGVHARPEQAERPPG